MHFRKILKLKFCSLMLGIIVFFLFIRHIQVSKDHVSGKTETFIYPLCNLSLQPVVMLTPYLKPAQCRVFLNNKCLFFGDLFGQPADFWTQDALSQSYQMYPMDVDVIKIVHQIKLGQPVNEAPIYNPNIALLSTSKHVCPMDQNNPVKYNIVVIVKSRVTEIKERQLFRETHNRLINKETLLVGLVFAVGLPKGTEHHNLEVLRSLKNEIDRYDDMIVGNFQEDYYNLTLKTTMSLRWAAKFCKSVAPIFLFIDVDHGFNAVVLANFLKTTTMTQQRKFLGGFTDCNMAVRYSFSYWAMKKTEIPWPIHPCFTYGFATLMGIDIVEDISIAIGYTKYLDVDDIYLGYVVNKLGLRYTFMPNFYRENRRVQNIFAAFIAPIKHLKVWNYRFHLHMQKN